MTPEKPDYARVDELFAAALERPEDQRSAYLDEACAEENGGELRRAVEELLRLAATRGTADTLDALREGELLEDLARAATPATGSAGELSAGSRIGPYRVTGELGRGGMGIVYRAERDEGDFEQTVAVKVLQTSLSEEAARSRFQEERAILASLHHPHIARLYDGGTIGDGRPYFAMELVEGRRIDRYCDEERLDVDQRLELFVKVARAVHHAHTNLVVHRDIKPSNILVDGDGEPKLLDFGIAKLAPPDDPMADRTRSAG